MKIDLNDLPPPVRVWAQRNGYTVEGWQWSRELPGVVYQPADDVFRIVGNPAGVLLRLIGSDKGISYYAAALDSLQQGFWLQTRQRAAVRMGGAL